MLLKRITLISIQAFVLSACNAEFKSHGDEPAAAAPDQAIQIKSESLSDFVKVRVEPSATAEKYMVFFGWPKFDAGKQLRIRLKNTLAVVKSDQSDFNHEVGHDQILNYSFEILDPSLKVERSFTKQVKIPRDFVVRDGQSEFFENQTLNVNRLFISSATHLVTNGFQVQITTNELRSDNGIIETFPEGSKATTDTPGKSAQDLTISANAAYGKLKVIMRGQNGGDGTKGAPYTSPAPNGQDAKPGEESCEEIGPVHDQTLGGKDVILQSSIEPQRLRCRCTRTGDNGTDGVPGAVGRKGNPAGAGGSTGNLRVSIIDARELEFSYEKIPGAPGARGPGGDGQMGGSGGQVPRGRICPGNAGNSQGQAGKGEDGDAAAEGSLGQACIYIASENRNECH